MVKKVVIVGGVAGGASTAARLRRLDEEADIVIYERGDHISFANCGLPYHIGGVIKDRERLLVQTPEAMEARFNISVKVKHEVKSIDKEKKEVLVKDLKNDQTFTESYDYLVLSPGAEPFKPAIEGIDSNNVFTLRNIPDTDRINDYLKSKAPKKAVVVGGGYIGIEMAENLQERGLEVSLVEMLDQVLSPLDYEMAAMVHNHLRMKGIKLYLKDGIKAVKNRNGNTNVVLESGQEIATDMVIMSIGVRPNVELAEGAELALGPTGGIKVNEYLQTSAENIYALGDAIEVNNLISGKPSLLPLAGPANKQGRITANNITHGNKEKYRATQATSIAKVFEMTVATTGNNEKLLKEDDLAYQVSYTNSNNHAGYYPGASPMFIKIIFTAQEGKLLGAQIIGHDGVDKRIDILATAVRHGLTVFDLQELELAYAPPYGSAKDPVNMAGFAAGNILKNIVEPIQYHEIDKLDDNVILLDVREDVEVQLGMIEGAIHIPVNSLRDRLDELDKNKEVVVYCAVGLRGYIACRILLQHGFNKVKNLVGGYKLYSAVEMNNKELAEEPGQEEVYSASNPEEGKIVGEKVLQKKAGQTVELDACGLQCPGPIMQVYQMIETLDEGDILEVTATDAGFSHDIAAWCKNTGNRLMESKEENGKYMVSIMKGLDETETMANKQQPKKKKTMVVFSGELDRAIASFIIANGAAAMGNEITMFFTFWGLNILRKDQRVDVNKSFMDKMFGKMMPRGSNKLPLSNMNMFGFGAQMIRRVMKEKGVDSLEDLIGQAKANGVKMVACQMSMDVMGIKKEELIDGVEVGGVATFLGESDEANMSLFI
ncbi:CoA-disulfide reductase [Iocasia frigidifontis]|uniref:CoA-disulfide reductase n=1 Tax=Iocasia fonsfrigidae TaxID=2682810 RepID=A0A8A7KH01_9FIRM|nr:CoA-disulfide reductase [Iocasia fonsfrigidae]QTL99028.1 CoA-disulfide reductase [Iocasia fonsfrigidae]